MERRESEAKRDFKRAWESRMLRSLQLKKRGWEKEWRECAKRCELVWAFSNGPGSTCSRLTTENKRLTST